MLFAIKIWCASTHLLCPFSFNFFRFVISAPRCVIFVLTTGERDRECCFVYSRQLIIYFVPTVSSLLLDIISHVLLLLISLGTGSGITWTREGMVLLLFINQPWPNPWCVIYLCSTKFEERLWQVVSTATEMREGMSRWIKNFVLTHCVSWCKL